MLQLENYRDITLGPRAIINGKNASQAAGMPFLSLGVTVVIVQRPRGKLPMRTRMTARSVHTEQAPLADALMRYGSDERVS